MQLLYTQFPSPYEVPNYKLIIANDGIIANDEFPSPYEVPNYK